MEDPWSSVNPTDQPINSSYRFSKVFTLQDGFLCCENIRIRDIQIGLEDKLQNLRNTSPAFVYSKSQIISNISAYQQALNSHVIPHKLGFSIKSNFNPHLVRLACKDCSCLAIAVSGNEVSLALELGVLPGDIILNGNGKQTWELELAVIKGCLINVDSDFDLTHLIEVTSRLQKSAQILLRLNPDIDANVHPFLSTGLAKSKFGIMDSVLFDLLKIIQSNSLIQLVGLHCHLGSTIDNTFVFSECLEVMLNLADKVKDRGILSLRFINLGGGLGINYKQHEFRTRPETVVPVETEFTDLLQNVRKVFTNIVSCEELCQLLTLCQQNKFNSSDVPRLKELLKGHTSLQNGIKKLFPKIDFEEVFYPVPLDLVMSVSEKLRTSGYTLILEPGRSIIGNAGLFVTKVIGTKMNGIQKYIVVDGSMTEVIRPALYGAYHHIELTEPSLVDSDERELFDVVGPVCECGDVLGKNRFLNRPHEGCGLALFDTGAYCSAMASNYNMRPRPVEVLVDGNLWTVIRLPETLQDIISKFNIPS